MISITGLQRTLGLLVVLSVMTHSAVAAECQCSNNMAVLGVYETATLESFKALKVTALVDSGAQTTALDARNIKMYVNRSGRRWVHYDFYHKPSGQTVPMHQPVNRVARIVTHSGVASERAVVMNAVSIGSIQRFLEMSLINRSNFPQQLLIGRNFLKGTALVDSGQKHLHSREI